MSSLISVLIPTCQRFDYFKAALDSVLKNGWEDLEVIVSEDKADGRVERYLLELQDARIRYTANTTPSGIINNYQNGALLARGEFIFKLDDDDLLIPGFLAASSQFLQDHPTVGSVYPAYELFERDDKPGYPVWDRDFFPCRNYVAAGADYLRAVLTNEGGYPRNQKTSAFYRRNLAAAIDFYGTAREDFLFSAALGLHGDVGYIPKVYYRWRQHPGNISTKFRLMWMSSEAALQSSARLSFSGTETVTEQEWHSLLQRCEMILPAYYLMASLQRSRRAQVLEFYRELEQRKPEALKRYRGIFAILFFLHRVFGCTFIILIYQCYIRFSMSWLLKLILEKRRFK